MKPAPTITVSNKTLISFVIPIYNSSEYINRTIESIKNSVNRREDYEIILVDDCSDDIDIIENRFKSQKNIKIIRKDRKTNASESRNIGIEESCGEFIFLLDSDDKIIKGYIEHRIKLHLQNDFGIYFGNFISHKKNQNIHSYSGQDFKSYIFIEQGDIRSSTISIYKKNYKGTLFDNMQNKHQDWGFGIRAYENNEKIGFDIMALIDIDDKVNINRMSNKMNIGASKYFIEKYQLNPNETCMFVRKHLSVTLETSDRKSKEFLKEIIKNNFLQMTLKFQALSTCYYFLLCLPEIALRTLLRLRRSQ